MLENSRTKLQLQFDEWYSHLHSRHLYVDSGATNNQSENGGNHIISPSTSSKIKPSDSVISSTTTNESASLVAASKSNYSSSSYDLSGSKISPKNRIDIATSKDESVNEDILAFYQAKEEMLKRRAGGGPR